MRRYGGREAEGHRCEEERERERVCVCVGGGGAVVGIGKVCMGGSCGGSGLLSPGNDRRGMRRDPFQWCCEG